MRAHVPLHLASSSFPFAANQQLLISQLSGRLGVIVLPSIHPHYLGELSHRGILVKIVLSCDH